MHTHITRVSRYLDGIRSFFNAPPSQPDLPSSDVIPHHRSVENLSRDRSASMTSRDHIMTSSSRDQEMWRARSLSYLGSMADTGTPLRSGSLVRFTASTESLSVMEHDEREGIERMERMERTEDGKDISEEGGTSSSSGICPLREEEPI
eukprot:sb/3473644/